MTVWLSLAISLVATAVAVIVMRRMVDRHAGSASVMDEIRREAGAILTEMNQTTERSIQLIEDQVARLQETIDLADKRLGTLRREADRQKNAEQVYSHLGRVSRLTPGAADHPPPSQPTVADGPASAGSGPSGKPAETTLSPAGSGSADSASSGAALVEAGATDTVPGMSGSLDDAAPAVQAESEPTMKERVLGLYRQGISVERIASRVGTAVSEIELIVSLGDRS
jgi:hypothetical protein